MRGARLWPVGSTPRWGAAGTLIRRPRLAIAPVQIRDIGSGNFGVAKLCRAKDTGELVAVKFIERGEKVGAAIGGSGRGGRAPGGPQQQASSPRCRRRRQRRRAAASWPGPAACSSLLAALPAVACCR
jgi:hypothetical protein